MSTSDSESVPSLNASSSDDSNNNFSLGQESSHSSLLPNFSAINPLATSVQQQQPFTFANIMGQGRVNQLGGVFINGRPLPPHIRLKIIEMATNGVKPCQISRQLRVSHGCVSKILYRYAETGSIAPGQIGGNPRSQKAIKIAEHHILDIKQERPELTASEIRALLISRRVCSRTNAPTVSSIARLIHTKGLKALESGQNSEKKIKHSVMEILDEPNDEPKIGYDTPCFEHRRSRTSFTPEQLEILEQAFRTNTYPDAPQRGLIAQKTGLTEGKIQVWFSNRRARCRKSINSAAFNPLVFPALPFGTSEIPQLFNVPQVPRDPASIFLYQSPLLNPMASTFIQNLHASKANDE